MIPDRDAPDRPALTNPEDAPVPGVPFPPFRVQAWLAANQLDAAVPWMQIRYGADDEDPFDGWHFRWLARIGSIHATYYGARPTVARAGYRLECFGLRVAALDALNGAPFCQIIFSEHEPGLVIWDPTGVDAASATWTTFTIQLWEQRAYVGDTPVYAYLRWHPRQGAERGVHCPLGYTATGQVWDAAIAGIAPLLAAAQTTIFRGPGRVRGSKNRDKYPDEESYRAGIRIQIYGWCDRRRIQVSDTNPTQWAKWLNLAYETFQARNREYNITIEDIRERRV
jgi:hypothetical protein